MAATDTGPSSDDVNAQRGIGAIYEASEALAKSAAELFSGIENDIPVTTLAAQALELRVAATRLEVTLDSVIDALSNLG